MKVVLNREQMRDIMDTYLRKYNVARPRYDAAKEMLGEYSGRVEHYEWEFKKHAELKVKQRELEMCEGIIKALEMATGEE